MTRLGPAGYPATRIVAPAQTGTRGLPGAAAGAEGDRSQAPPAREPAPLPGEGMLLPGDRGCGAGGLLTAVAAAGAKFLTRGTSTGKPPVLEVLPAARPCPDRTGSRVWIIEADLLITGTAGSRTADHYRLISTLTDHRRYRRPG